jgi:Glycosyl hydrolases family 43
MLPRSKKLPVIAVLVTVVLLAAGCLIPSGNPNSFVGSDFPDPAAVQISFTDAEVYATSASGRNLPEADWPINSYGVTGLQDVFSSNSYLLSWGDTPGFIWAPTVSYIAGNYVMWFASPQSNGGPACLNSAYSSNGTPTGPWYIHQKTCGYPAGYGMVDPSIFKAADGSLWLFFSVETVPPYTHDSEIVGVSLDSSGLDWGSQSFVVAHYNDLANVPCLQANNCLIWNVRYTLGGNSEVENPEVVIDPSPTNYNNSGTYYKLDVFVSYGTWNATQAYHTLEFACQSLVSGQSSISCGPGAPAGSDVSGNVMGGTYAEYVDNPGGWSLMDPGPGFNGSTPMGFFAAANAGTNVPRLPYWETTQSYYRTYP